LASPFGEIANVISTRMNWHSY